jgi:hypothetical protein
VVSSSRNRCEGQSVLSVLDICKYFNCAWEELTDD